MAYWNGTHWEQPDAAPKKARPSRFRHTLEAVTEGTLIALLIVAMIAGTTFAAKGGGKGHGSLAAAMTMTANPDVVHSGDLFDVDGCGFDTSLGNVIVGFTGGSWGSPLDAGGCFTIDGILALSGDVMSPGTYEVTAYQYINGRWRAVKSTTVRVVAD